MDVSVGLIRLPARLGTVPKSGLGAETGWKAGWNGIPTSTVKTQGKRSSACLCFKS